MDNATLETVHMTAYSVMENHKHEVFSVFLLLYVTTITLNSLLISVIYQNKELHAPMNVFTCMLSINEIYGSSAMLPAVLALILSKTHEVPLRWCMAQVYFLHTYASGEFSILALMGYDRYVAICYPLHYHTIMSTSKMLKLIVFIGLYPLIVFGCLYSLTIQLRFCGNVIPKLYCVNMELVKNSCLNPQYISIVGLVFIFILIVPHVVMILFSYVQISRVCRKLSKESQYNALKTCIPHLISFFNYTIGSLFEIIQSRFQMTHVALETRIFLSLYFIITPPIINPIVYGLGTHLVRAHILKLFLPRKLAKAVTAAY
ncbi:olfactory receptor 52K1-like [Parambassis ranga]|uniref:Olfactory receptor n=1 Tax=Parambassis ranga TaxID=210632 RepID=A0A6P7JM30_9TELE|nr:olfactory receptor 52K1-like [Parambassis ranga]